MRVVQQQPGDYYSYRLNNNNGDGEAMMENGGIMMAQKSLPIAGAASPWLDDSSLSSCIGVMLCLLMLLLLALAVSYAAVPYYGGNGHYYGAATSYHHLAPPCYGC